MNTVIETTDSVYNSYNPNEDNKFNLRDEVNVNNSTDEELDYMGSRLDQILRDKNNYYIVKYFQQTEGSERYLSPNKYYDNYRSIIAQIIDRERGSSTSKEIEKIRTFTKTIVTSRDKVINKLIELTKRLRDEHYNRSVIDSSSRDEEKFYIATDDFSIEKRIHQWFNMHREKGVSINNIEKWLRIQSIIVQKYDYLAQGLRLTETPKVESNDFREYNIIYNNGSKIDSNGERKKQWAKEIISRYIDNLISANNRKMDIYNDIPPKSSQSSDCIESEIIPGDHHPVQNNPIQNDIELNNSSQYDTFTQQRSLSSSSSSSYISTSSFFTMDNLRDSNNAYYPNGLMYPPHIFCTNGLLSPNYYNIHYPQLNPILNYEMISCLNYQNQNQDIELETDVTDSDLILLLISHTRRVMKNNFYNHKALKYLMVGYGTFTIKSIDDTVECNDVDVYHSDAYRYLIVIMCFLHFLFGIGKNLRIHCIPMIIRHTSLRFVSQNGEKELFDCIQLNYDCLKHIHKQIFDNMFFLHCLPQSLNNIRMLSEEIRINKLMTNPERYKNIYSQIFFNFITSSKIFDYKHVIDIIRLSESNEKVMTDYSSDPGVLSRRSLTRCKDKTYSVVDNNFSIHGKVISLTIPTLWIINWRKVLFLMCYPGYFLKLIQKIDEDNRFIIEMNKYYFALFNEFVALVKNNTNNEIEITIDLGSGNETLVFKPGMNMVMTTMSITKYYYSQSNTLATITKQACLASFNIVLFLMGKLNDDAINMSYITFSYLYKKQDTLAYAETTPRYKITGQHSTITSVNPIVFCNVNMKDKELRDTISVKSFINIMSELLGSWIFST